MKLIITQHNLNEKGGAEKVILKIAQKYDATIYTLGYDKTQTFEEFKDVDIKVFSSKGHVSKLLPARVGNAVYYGYNFYNLKIPENYDVLNPHMSPSEWIRNRNPRALWYCHTPPRELYDPTVANLRQRSLKEKILYRSLSRVYGKVEKNIVKNMEGIATNSATTQMRIKKIFGRNSTVVHPGVDYKDFGNKGDYKYFLYHSRIAEQKRQEYAIAAFEKFNKSMNGKYKLVLSGSLSKRYKDFENYYEKLKAMKAKNVIFKLNPSDKELKLLYGRCTALLFSAINEDFGIVPLEGMASAKPVISVNEGGPKEVIINQKTGFLVDSVEQMANKMQLIAQNPSLAQRMGKEGRKRVEKHYSWKAFFDGFDPLLRQVKRMGD